MLTRRIKSLCLPLTAPIFVACSGMTAQEQVADYQEAFNATYSSYSECISESGDKYDLLTARAQRSEAERLIDNDLLSGKEQSQLIGYQREREECQRAFRSSLSSLGYSTTYPINTESWWSAENARAASLLSREISWGQFFRLVSDDFAGRSVAYDQAMLQMYGQAYAADVEAAQRRSAAIERMGRAAQQMGQSAGAGSYQGQMNNTVACRSINGNDQQVYTFSFACPPGYLPVL